MNGEILEYVKKKFIDLENSPDRIKSSIYICYTTNTCDSTSTTSIVWKDSIARPVMERAL